MIQAQDCGNQCCWDILCVLRKSVVYTKFAEWINAARSMWPIMALHLKRGFFLPPSLSRANSKMSVYYCAPSIMKVVEYTYLKTELYLHTGVVVVIFIKRLNK